MASFWLEFDQDGRRQQYNFDAQQVTVGREQGSDLFLDHPTVSRQHAIFRSDHSGIRLVVLSKSGLTAVNGTPVQGEVGLSDGTQVHFGQLGFVFRAPQAQASPGFGAQSQGFGAQPQGVGAQQQGFGAQPQGFGAQPQGFGAQPQGFGAQQPQGFGAQPAAGFGGQPAGGFGSQPQGFGAAPPAAGQAMGFGNTPSGGFSNPSGGFGAPPAAGGGFGQQTGGFGAAPAPPKPASDDGHGIMSWDEIAKTADEDSGKVNGVSATDFQRLEAASKKANDQSKGSPLILVGIVLIAGMMGFLLWPADETDGSVGPEPPIEEAFPIVRGPTEVDCVGAAECKAKAEQNFRVGSELLDKVEVDIQNRFEGYNRLLLAEEYLKKAGIETIPPEFTNLEVRRDKARGELDTIFRDLRVRYHNASKRKMYREMVDSLNQVLALFPHKGSREHIWALKLERELKDAGNYPPALR